MIGVLRSIGTATGVFLMGFFWPFSSLSLLFVIRKRRLYLVVFSLKEFLRSIMEHFLDLSFYHFIFEYFTILVPF